MRIERHIIDAQHFLIYAIMVRMHEENDSRQVMEDHPDSGVRLPHMQNARVVAVHPHICAVDVCFDEV